MKSRFGNRNDSVSCYIAMLENESGSKTLNILEKFLSRAREILLEI